MEHTHTIAAADAGAGGFFSNLLQDYVPRQQCMFYQTDLIWLHVVSDFFIAFAYFSIPVALVYFVRRRKDLAFHWMFFLFALFIVLCGTTHIFGILAMWHAYYRLDGLIKFATAIASLGTAIALWKLIPLALALPGMAEIKKRKDELEELVQHRTAELTEIIRALGQSRDRAEAASLAKSNFLANMSHEIRTPMNAIVGLTDLLQRSSADPEKQKVFLKTMEASATQLMGLINDLLDISKIEHKNIALDETSFSLGRILTEVVNINAVSATGRGIELFNDYDYAQDIQVRGDPLRLKQILTNVVGNAIKFTEKGYVKIRTQYALRNGLADITIDVIDTGIGIPADTQEAIFYEFYQGDTSITRKYGGTGLGLSISKTLLDLMGGDISVQSTLGQGSTFTIMLSLPLHEVSSRKADKPDKKTAAAEKTPVSGCVLLVEDNAANILVAASVIETLGYECISAMSGKEALNILETKKIDIILMDIQMPEMDGYTTTKIIREREKQTGKKRVPVIGVTAHALIGDREKCLAADMDDYLSKPFRIDELEAMLERYNGLALDNRR